MCLIAFAHQVHPRYRLVLVANRDEYYSRPTETADWWRTTPDVLAGRDLQAGGTWLGVDARGRWAAVTNYREGVPQPGFRSRGELPCRFLQSDLDNPGDYVEEIVVDGSQYAGFNLLAGDGNRVVYGSNRGGAARMLDPGVHTLSNHLLDTPWPKAQQARFKLEHALRQPRLSAESLLSVLADREPFDDHHLPATGAGLAQERLLSPAFIVGSEYGTRSTTVLLVEQDGEVVFAEQNFHAGEPVGKLRLFRFTPA